MHARTTTKTTAALGFLATMFIGLIAATPSTRAQSTPSSDLFDQAADRAEQQQSPGSQDLDDTTQPKLGGLRMSRAVVCESIDGFEDYKVLRGASQTSEEKLLIYYRPLGYTIKRDEEGFYTAHLTQDNEIRKRGKKKVLRAKKKVVEYEPKHKDGIGPIYIRNTISLKGLKPGEYDITIILHDILDPDAPPSRQIVRFKVIPPHDGASDDPPPASDRDRDGTKLDDAGNQS